jgi:hypothetical protein
VLLSRIHHHRQRTLALLYCLLLQLQKATVDRRPNTIVFFINALKNLYYIYNCEIISIIIMHD